MSFKRPRTPVDRSPASSPSPLEPTPKSSRTNPSSSQRPLLCSLPPTCNPPRNQPTHIANTRDLESHYAMYHAHVCEFQGCGCVFPEARLLELHQTECHDPLAALRKERGEKIFACHLSSCTRLFSSPKTRRLHLIDTHAYPKAYFFAVTNKGIGGLLQKWGEGATMLRREWKDRGANEDAEEPMETDNSITESQTSMHKNADGGGHTTPPPPYLSHTQTQSESQQSPTTGTEENADDHVDDLVSSMGSLSLVPPSIRFGRGGRSGGFGNGAGGVNGHGETYITTDPQPATNAGANITRGGRGRGKARNFVPPSANGNHVLPAQAAAVRGAGKTRGGGPGGINKVDLVDQINSPQIGVKNGGRGGFGGGRGGRGGIVHVPRGRGGVGRGRIVPRGRGRGI